MWSRRDKFEETFEQLISALAARQSDPLFVEHMADCVRDRERTDAHLDDIRAELKEQNRDNNEKHKENSERLQKLNAMLIAALLGLAMTLLSQIVTLTKDHSMPPVLIEQGNHARP